MRVHHMFATVAFTVVLASQLNSAFAVTIFSNGPPGNPDENVQFNDAGLVSRGLTITGATNNTGFVVDFISKDSPIPNVGDFELFTPSGGQAKVEGIDSGDDQVLYSSVEIVPNATANPNFGFTWMEFNVNIANKASGLLQLVIKGTGFSDITTTVDKDSAALSLGNGSNKFGITTGAGELIQSVQLNVIDDATNKNPLLIVEDIRQLRISGAEESDDGTVVTTSSANPEPSSLVLAAIAIASLGMARRRRR